MSDHGRVVPRVLVVSAPPMGGVGGTGVTLANLFTRVPPDHIASLHLDPGTADPHLSGSSLRVPEMGAPMEARVRRAVGRKTGGVSAPSGIVAAGSVGSARGRASAWGTAALDLSPVRLSTDVLDWARESRPVVIYSPLGSVRVMRIVRILSERLNIPVLPHFMDDWPRTLYSDHEFFGLARRRVQEELRSVIRRSPFLLAISRPMAEEYGDIFRRNGRVFMNCVNDEDFAAPSAARTAGPARILTYIGGLHLERWRSLIGLAQTLLHLDPQIELRVHAPEAHLREHQLKVADFPNVRWGPSLNNFEVPAALAAADVLVHVESFEPGPRRYTRLSISTKIPQYLAAARPILAVGPTEVASMRYLIETGSAVVIQQDDKMRLAALLTDHALRSTMAERGLAQAHRFHERSTVSWRFLGALSEAGWMKSQ